MKTFKPNWLPERLPPREPRHQREEDRDLIKFYKSKDWKDLRIVKLESDPCCEVCLRRGIVRPAGNVHHRKEVREYPDLALDLDNLESLCIGCHNRTHGYLRKNKNA